MYSFCLIFAVFFPFAIAAVNLAIPNRSEKIRNIVNFAASVINLVPVIYVFCSGQDSLVTILHFTEKLYIGFQSDRMGLLFATLVSILWPFSLLYSYEYMENEERKNRFYSFYMMTLGCVIGISFSDNLFSLYIFYELLTLATFPLVMHTMTKQAMEAGMTYLCYMLGGAAFSFISMMVVLYYTDSLSFINGGYFTSSDPATKNLMILMFVIMFLGFSVKAAMLPFSTWLIKAAVAPMPVTALLHAVAVVKAGAFACIRIIYRIFGVSLLKGTWGQYVALCFTIATILYGSVMSVREPHLKRRMAYSTISNLSYILFGACLMTPLGLTASLTHLVAHAITKIGLFYIVGAIMHHTGKEYVYELNGIGRKMKIMFAAFTIGSLSLIGIPQFIGFVSKVKLIQASIDEGSVLAIAGGFAIILSALLTAIYLFGIVVRAFFPTDGAVCEGYDSIKDPGMLMRVPIVILTALTFIIGVWWQPLVDFISKI